MRQSLSEEFIHFYSEKNEVYRQRKVFSDFLLKVSGIKIFFFKDLALI